MQSWIIQSFWFSKQALSGLVPSDGRRCSKMGVVAYYKGIGT